MFDLDLSSLLPIAVVFSAVIAGVGAVLVDEYRKPKILGVESSGNIHQVVPQIELESDVKRLGAAQANSGVRMLVRYSYDLKPDFIVGVNRGGVMIGAFLALAAGIPDRKFLRCGVLKAPGGREIDLKFEYLEGVVLIVDDVSRTGNTLKYVRDMVTQSCPRVKSVCCAVLVMAGSKNENSIKEEQRMYAPIIARCHDLLLPWSPSESRVLEDGFLESGSRRVKEYNEIASTPIKEVASEVYDSID